jgi:cytochrome c peroxidase
MGVIGRQLTVHRDSAQRPRFGRHEDEELGVDVLEQLFGLLPLESSCVAGHERIEIGGEDRSGFDSRRENDLDVDSGRQVTTNECPKPIFSVTRGSDMYYHIGCNCLWELCRIDC